MKIILTLLLLVSTIININAQVPFPTDQAIWANAFYQEIPQWPMPYYQLTNVTNYCVDAQDTSINSFTYTKITECGGSYHGAFRELGQAVWYVPADSTTEFLIYDFDVIPGEILQNVYFEQGGFMPMLQDLTVNNVTTIQINGIDRVSVDFGSGPQFSWIEGIGAASGFLCEPWQNISQYQVNLLCMSVAGEVLYPTYGPGACPLDLGLEEEPHHVDFWPNPVDGILNISGHGYEEDLKIFDPFGRAISVRTQHVNDGKQFDLHGLSPGVYFLGTSPENGQKVIKL